MSDFKRTAQQKLIRLGIIATILLVAFLIGLVPMWIQKRAVANELVATQKHLQRSEINILLTTAIVESNRGEYEAARKNASDFFTRVQAEIDKGDESSLNEEERKQLVAIFANRDTTITMLAQRDQASTERLTDIYEIYRKTTAQTLDHTKTNPTSSNTSATQQTQ